MAKAKWTQASKDNPIFGGRVVVSSSPEQRLLRAMVTLNAINNGRPVPDFNTIECGWVTTIDPNASAKETGKQIMDKARSVGWSQSSKSGGSTDD
mgnify:CR=1 FL=1